MTDFRAHFSHFWANKNFPGKSKSISFFLFLRFYRCAKFRKKNPPPLPGVQKQKMKKKQKLLKNNKTIKENNQRKQIKTIKENNKARQFIQLQSEKCKLN